MFPSSPFVFKVLFFARMFVRRLYRFCEHEGDELREDINKEIEREKVKLADWIR